MIRGRFNGYDIHTLHAAYSFLHLLKGEGITHIDDVILKVEEYIEEKAHVKKMQQNKRKYHREKVRVVDVKCSVCGGPAYVDPVNTGPRDQTGDDSKTAIICYNYRGCGHTDYSTKTIKEYPMKWVLAKYDRAKGVKFRDLD